MFILYYDITDPNTEEIVEEVQVRKPSLASKFSFKKNVPVHEEKRSLVPADTETAEATNTARATSPTEKPPVGKSDSLPRRILATTASFGKKKEKIDAAPLIDGQSANITFRGCVKQPIISTKYCISYLI